MRDLVKQTAFDNFIHYTFVYFPFFYVFKEAIQQETGVDATPLMIATNGLSRYRDNAFEDNAKMWALWIPGDLVIYAVPIWMRLPCNHALSFVWTCYLSFLRGEPELVENDDDNEEAEAEAGDKDEGTTAKQAKQQRLKKRASSTSVLFGHSHGTD